MLNQGGETLAYRGSCRQPAAGPQHLVAAAAEKEREKLRQAARDLYHQIQSGRAHTVPFSSWLWFRLWQAGQSQGVFASETGEPDPDQKYWQEQGWLSPRCHKNRQEQGWLEPSCHYFYPVPLNPLQRLLGRASAGVFRQVIKRM